MRPLEDVRVVALEQYGAGPFGSLHLAELGADVIKRSDAGRAVLLDAAGAFGDHAATPPVTGGVP